MELYSKDEKLKMFLEFLLANGFEKEEVRNIIEVGYSLESSLTPLLDPSRYNSLLVSLNSNDATTMK